MFEFCGISIAQKSGRSVRIENLNEGPRTANLKNNCGQCLSLPYPG